MQNMRSGRSEGKDRMNRKKRSLNCIMVFILATLCMMMCNGCVGKIPKTDVEKEINYYITLVPSNLDPETAFTEDNCPVIMLYAEGLMTKDREGRLIPGVAERYEVSEDGLTYRFYIRDNAFWSNGTPVTSDDFVFGWQRVVDPETASDGIFLFLNCFDMVGAKEAFFGEGSVEDLGIRAVTDKILEVKLNRPCPYLTDLLCSNIMFPCNREFYYKHKETYGKDSDSIISCGPFTVDYYEPLGMQLHLRKNEYYYDASYVQIPGINIQVLDDVQQLIMSFEKGEADMIPLSGEQLEVSEGDPRLVETPAKAIEYLLYNANNEAMSNKNIRRALTMTVNRKFIHDVFYSAGAYELTRLLPDKLFYEPDGSDFAADQSKYDEYCDYDVKKAREYWNKGLEEMGVSEISAAVLTTSNDNLFLDVLKEEWENDLPGFTLTYRMVPAKAYVESLRNGDFDICVFGYSADYADPTTFLNLFKGGANANFGKYDNDKYNEILDMCESEPVANDPVKRMELLHQAEDVLIEDAAFAPLLSIGSAQLVSDRVHGVVFTPLAPMKNFKFALKEAE